MDATPALPDPPPDPPHRPAAPLPAPEPGPAPAPEPARRSCDPWAVGLANASLLGIGYAMLGRRKPAVAAGSASVVLVALLAGGAQATWLPVLALLWWVAVTAHGWFLAGGRPRRGARAPLGDRAHGPWGGVRRQRLVALGVAAPVLLGFGALRVDAAGIEEDAAEAHRRGDCEQALSMLEGLGAGHRVADARLVARSEDSIEACELLTRAEEEAESHRMAAARTLEEYEAHPGAAWEGARGRRADLILAQATAELETGLTGDTRALTAGFDHLAAVLGEFAGREAEVEEVLDGFLGALPVEDACETKEVTDWLGQRPASGDALDRAGDIVPRIAPAAILGCGDDAMANDQWDTARVRYRQLLDEYPDHDLAGEATDGVERASTAIELARLRELLEPGSAGGQPAYCDDPAPYRGAEAYEGSGPHPALLFGRGDNKKRLPDSWLADGAEDATLVICAGENKFGTAVTTCTYEYESDIAYIGGLPTTDVTFHNKKVPVRVYEVRTGKQLDISSLEIGGASCPDELWYEYYIYDTGPEEDVYVRSSPADVRAAYEDLIFP